MNNKKLLKEWLDTDKKGFVVALKNVESVGWTHYQKSNLSKTKILTEAQIFEEKAMAEAIAPANSEIIPLDMIAVIEFHTPLSES